MVLSPDGCFIPRQTGRLTVGRNITLTLAYESFEMAVRRLRFERQSPASKDRNTEAEEAMALEAITRRQPVKIQQTEKILYIL
jgi:hypothetical protein